MKTTSFRKPAFLPMLVLLLLHSIAHAGRDFPLIPDTNVVGMLITHEVRPKESLIEIARHFDLGYNEIIAANPGIEQFVPGTGTRVTIPSSWVLPDVDAFEGIIINLSELRLYHFPKDKKKKLVHTYPIGIGDQGTETPLGTFKVIQKMVNPAWYPPESIRKERPELPKVVPPGPENPLGTHALRLSLNTVLIHGTNRPFAIGRKASHGCIRMYPEDIPDFYDEVPTGTKVTIVRQPIKIGKKNGRVLIEVHHDEYITVNYFQEAARLLQKKGLLKTVNSEKLLAALKEKRGIPVDISE